MMTSMSSAQPGPPARRTGAAARILRDARLRAGLTQRALAAASGIPQESIARIERSTVQPRFDTLALLLDACGFELEVMSRLGIGVDTTMIDSALDMTPAERLARGQQAAAGVRWLQTAVRRAPADPP